MTEVRKTKTIVRKALLTLSRQEIEAAIVDAVKRDNRELKDYTFTVGWDADDGGCVIVGTLTSGTEAPGEAEGGVS